MEPFTACGISARRHHAYISISASFSARHASGDFFHHPQPRSNFSLFFAGVFPPFLVDFFYTTGPIFRLKPSQVSVSNCSGAAPIAQGSDDQHMQLWARACRELTRLRHGLATDLEIVGQVPLRALPANRNHTHHTSHLYGKRVYARF